MHKEAVQVENNPSHYQKVTLSKLVPTVYHTLHACVYVDDIFVFMQNVIMLTKCITHEDYIALLHIQVVFCYIHITVVGPYPITMCIAIALTAIYSYRALFQ